MATTSIAGEPQKRENCRAKLGARRAVKFTARLECNS